MQTGSTPKVGDPFDDLNTPDAADTNLQLQKYVQQGVITPEEAETIRLGDSSMNGITLDPSLKKQQMASLGALQEIADSGGMTDMDQANLSRIRNEEDAAARGKREAILQNAQMRGMGGSGLELMSQMQNQQDSATRASQRDMDVAGQAQQRALEAIMQGGNMAGNIRGQDFSQAAQVAGANDAISKFNAQNQQQQINQNVGNRNNAQIANLNAKQGVANANTDMNNEQQKYNKQLIQQKFNNEMAKRTGTGNVAQANATAAGQNSQARANSDNQTIGMALTAMSDERQKTDVEEFSPSEFLDSLTSYKYKYKQPRKHGEGEQVGVMAQDMEKTDMGSKMVTDTPEGKMVDYSKSGPAIMSSLADINKRLKQIEGKG